MRQVNFRSHVAESMIETLVAITVIVIATATALSLMRTALTGNQVVEDKVIALNLAVEGLNAVKNIRDTNYLNFAGSADDCWNNFVNVQNATSCTDPANKVSTGGTSYYLLRSTDTASLFDWSLKETSRSNTGLLDLYSIDAGATLYAQQDIMDSSFTLLEEGRFSRTISFESTSPTEYLDATITVSWTTAGVAKSLSLTRTIANVF